VDLQEYREKSYEVWEAVAPGWREKRDFVWETSRKIGEWLVARLEPKPGQTILELAAGLGDTGFAAARKIGDGGKLISTDFSPQMVEAARQRGKELGLTNVEHRVMDAESMNLEDDSVDGVLCRWGYMLMADPPAAFAETRRVLRDGGRLCFSVWTEAERNPFAAVPGAVLVAHGHMPPPEPGAPGIFALADPERVGALVTGAGFEQPEIEEVPVEWRFGDFDEYWGFIVEISGSAAQIIRGLPEDEQRAVREQVEASAQGFRANDAYVLPGVALNVVTS
jgi:SAM-dependent methyltransferase